MMPKLVKAIPEPATACVGFGCGFVLSLLGLVVILRPVSTTGLIGIAAIAVVLGLLTARFGEPFFEKLMALFG
jgi:hypothetical protein